MVEYLRRDPDAVAPDPVMTYGSPPALSEVMQAGNDAFGIPIVSLGAPTDPTDAATKFYVDAAGPFFVGDVDPTTVEPIPAVAVPGAIWVKTNNDPTTWQRRNEANDGWDAPFLMMYDDGMLAVVGNDTVPVTVTNGDANILLAPDTITIQLGSGTELVITEFTVVINGTVIDGGGNITFATDGVGLPTADPEVAGKVYIDGALAPGVPQPLMVSGGPA